MREVLKQLFFLEKCQSKIIETNTCFFVDCKSKNKILQHKPLLQQLLSCDANKTHLYISQYVHLRQSPGKTFILISLIFNYLNKKRFFYKNVIVHIWMMWGSATTVLLKTWSFFQFECYENVCALKMLRSCIVPLIKVFQYSRCKNNAVDIWIYHISIGRIYPLYGLLKFEMDLSIENIFSMLFIVRIRFAKKINVFSLFKLLLFC